MSAQLFLGFMNSATLSRSSRYLLTAGSLTALSLAISSAHAAGIEYSKQSVAPFLSRVIMPSYLMRMLIQKLKAPMPLVIKSAT